MVHRMFRIAFACSALGLILSGGAAHAQFADLEGQFILDGDIPTLTPKVEKGDPNAKDAAVCAVEEIPNYTLTVNPDNKGIRDIFVYIRKPTKVNPELAAVPMDDLIIDQKQCTFIPHSMIVRCKQQVIAKSEDAVPHNIHGINVVNSGFNFTVPPNDREGQKVPIDKANAKQELQPIKVECNIHPHMEAYWMVIDHPYGATTDADGKFKISGLPVGKNTITIWHSTGGYLAKTLDVDVKAGGTVMEPLKVKAQAAAGTAKLLPLK